MFSTGQVVEGAVNYTGAAAVCGKIATGDDPTIANNQTNLTLPAIQACAQPIGPKWVASITNWLCFAIDGAGLQYASGSVCQDPLLLFRAIISLAQKYGGNILEGPSYQLPDVMPKVPTAPPNSVGQDGQYYQEQETGTMFGPKANGAWPSYPVRFGKGLSISVQANAQIAFYNSFIEIGPQSGASNWITTVPSAINQKGNRETISNISNQNQTIVSAGGLFTGEPQWPETGGVTTLTLIPGQTIEMVSDGAGWIIEGDNLNFLAIGNYATPISAPIPTSTYIIGLDGNNDLVKFTVAELTGGSNSAVADYGVGSSMPFYISVGSGQTYLDVSTIPNYSIDTTFTVASWVGVSNDNNNTYTASPGTANSGTNVVFTNGFICVGGWSALSGQENTANPQMPIGSQWQIDYERMVDKLLFSGGGLTSVIGGQIPLDLIAANGGQITGNYPWSYDTVAGAYTIEIVITTQSGGTNGTITNRFPTLTYLKRIS